VFEDHAVAFKEEDTPVEFSRTTSLSSLTIDDEPKICNDAMLKVCLFVCLCAFYLSVHLCVCTPVCPFVCMYTCLYSCSFVRSSFGMFFRKSHLGKAGGFFYLSCLSLFKTVHIANVLLHL